jgi:hypothetical protein
MPLRRCNEEGDGGGGDLHRRGRGRRIHLRFLQRQWWRGGGRRLVAEEEEEEGERGLEDDVGHRHAVVGIASRGGCNGDIRGDGRGHMPRGEAEPRKWSTLCS